MEFGDARVGAEKEKYGILGKTVKIIKTPLARHNFWTSTLRLKFLTAGDNHPNSNFKRDRIVGQLLAELFVDSYDGRLNNGEHRQ